MFSVKGEATIATVTDLRRLATQIIDRVEAGESVVLQRNAEAVGVLLNYSRYQRLIEAEERLENFELLLLARQREAAIANGEDDVVPLSALMEELGVEREVEADRGEEV
jgi:prevent-host-death family protein